MKTFTFFTILILISQYLLDYIIKTEKIKKITGTFILILGLIIVFANYSAEKKNKKNEEEEKIKIAEQEEKNKIQSLKDQLNDNRWWWDNNESTYKIMSIYKKLQKLNVKNIDLSSCYLEGAAFLGHEFEMKGVNLSNALMNGSRLQTLDLTKSRLIGTKLQNSHIIQCNFSNANLRGVNLTNAQIGPNVKFNNADLSNAILINIMWQYPKEIEHKFPIDFTGANLDGAFVEKNWLENIKNYNIIGIDQKYEVYEYGNYSINIRKKYYTFKYRLRKK